MDQWDEKVLQVIEQGKMIQKEKGGGYAAAWLQQVKNHDEIYIFGAGEHGGCWYEILKKWGVLVKHFCDNNFEKWNQTVIDGVSCIAPENLVHTEKKTAVIVALRNYADVLLQIENWNNKNIDVFIGSLNKVSYLTNYEYMGNEEKLNTLYIRIKKVMELCEDERSKELCYQTLYKWLLDPDYSITFDSEAYFYTGKFPFSEQESFVDIGAYDGDTIDNFLKVTQNQFEKIYAFEMDHINYKNLECEIQKKSDQVKTKIKLFPVGVSDKTGNAYYKSSFQTSGLSMQGTEQCHIDCLDNLLKDKSVTMIKMDIEGEEQKALKGAKNLIRAQKPKLAICVYHSIDDFLEIPLYLQSLNSDYRLFLRHHSMDDSETVCYAY